ncbi:DNA (cytosine-5)-methyltransferase CMT2, partial [Dissostichus eleginoides]
YSGTSRGTGCKDPITPPLSLSHGVVLVEGWLGRGGGPFTPDRTCHSNAKPQLLKIRPSCPPLPPPFYYFSCNVLCLRLCHLCFYLQGVYFVNDLSVCPAGTDSGSGSANAPPPLGGIGIWGLTDGGVVG